ncbi:hypothetical protein CBS101457_004076 [Exobasidium rhododendri]|nr:hypothetical protein CBS101457_004076 [Exobasidium rhododendri]
MMKQPQSPVKSSSASTSAVPQSLGRKKDRVRRSLLDEDEGGSTSIRAGSPSPSKMQAERAIALCSSTSSVANGAAVQRGKSSGTWTVWQDQDDEIEAANHATDVSGATSSNHSIGAQEHTEEKENVKPSTLNSFMTSRKKGTGGRLSLLATADEVEGESTTDTLGKRRKVTPMSAGVSLH